MSAKRFRPVTAWAAMVAVLWSGPASAQCPTCGPPPVASMGCATCAPAPVCQTCAPVQTCQVMTPIVQPCYQKVPVTEYRPEKRTVQKPVCDVEYVDQPVTEYRPITEQKTAEVPTMTWQTVTEYRTVQRDMGHWVTNYECKPKVAACDYDCRPGVAGWWNRSAYSMRSAFEPTMVAKRTWCPNVVAQSCPVTKQVPQYGTRQVAYNCTRMEPYQSTRKVAVQKVRYVAEETTVMTPVTVMRDVPIGTSVAWAVTNPCGVPGSSGGATALAPAPDPSRSASGGSLEYDGRPFNRGTNSKSAFGADGAKSTFDGDPVAPVKQKPISAPLVRPNIDGTHYPEARVPVREPAREKEEPVVYGPETTVPAVAARSVGWVPRSRRMTAKPVENGPALPDAEVASKSGR